MYFYNSSLWRVLDFSRRAWNVLSCWEYLPASFADTLRQKHLINLNTPLFCLYLFF